MTVAAGALAAAVAAIAAAGALTACGPPASSASEGGGATSAGTPAVSLATSLSTVTGSWAVVPVAASPVLWEVLVRPAMSATWRLVTPPGVDVHGGLVAADGGSSLTVAVRPSQNLLFSPLAATADAGRTWSTPAPLSSGVAASPGALAASGRQLLAVLGDGAMTASSDAGVSWHMFAPPGALAASSAGRPCGPLGVSSVSFGRGAGVALAAGSCGTTGITGIFSHSALSASGQWQRVRLPVPGPVLRLFSGGMTLVRAKTGLTALWDGTAGRPAGAPLAASGHPSAASWTASAPWPVPGPVAASGELAGSASAAGDGAWALLPGGQAATISGPGQPWLLLPRTPARTSALASGPDGAIDAVAAAGSGATLTVWRLRPGATVWTRIQFIAVPVQYGSSS